MLYIKSRLDKGVGQTTNHHSSDHKVFQDDNLEINPKVKLYDITRDPEDFINYIDILRGKLDKFNIKIYDMEMITHTLNMIVYWIVMKNKSSELTRLD